MPYVYVFALAFIASLIMTPVVRKIALASGALSQPGLRSVHTKPTPHMGGLAIYIAFSIAIVMAFGWRSEVTWGMLVGGFVIVLVGIVDDFITLSPRMKVLGQVLAALVLVGFGVRIEHVTNPLTGGMLPLFSLAIPLTVIWVVAMTNIVNLIDGLDGLAAGIASIASFTLMLAAVRMGPDTPGYIVTMPLTAALAGSALGFLPYNFNPAKIFMGDAGAMFLGYALAAVSVEGALKSTATVAVAVPILALGLPIFDTVFAIVRRRRKGVPVSSADRDHLHHRLLQLGLTHRETVVAMYFVSGWLGLSALALMELGTLHAAAVIIFIGVSVYFAAKRIGVLDAQSPHRHEP